MNCVVRLDFCVVGRTQNLAVKHKMKPFYLCRTKQIWSHGTKLVFSANTTSTKILKQLNLLPYPGCQSWTQNCSFEPCRYGLGSLHCGLWSLRILKSNQTRIQGYVHITWHSFLNVGTHQTWSQDKTWGQIPFSTAGLGFYNGHFSQRHDIFRYNTT
jgi:hypothetical protein